MNIAFCYNVKHIGASKNLTAQAEAEFDSPETIRAVENALKSRGHKVLKIEADEDSYLKFKENREWIDIVFNISEGLRGAIREAQIPALLEMLGIPYTHSGALTEAITLDKTLTKQVLIHSNIPTPRYQLFRTGKELINPDLKYPLLVKPNSEGSSKGIFNENLVMDPVKLFERIEFVISQFKQEALVEEFIDGREFTVAILGNPPKVLPIVEQNYTIFPENMPHLASYEAKWLFEDQLPNPHDSYFCPAKLDANTEKLITNTCIRIWEALDIKDVARIDLRLDRNGIPNVLEVNTMPGLIPDQNVVSYFPVAARKSGLNYEEMVNTILDSAVKRYGLKQVQKSSLIREYAVVEKNSKS